MLEQETTQISSHLVQRIIGQNDRIGMQNILAGSVPRGVKTYLRAEVTRWLTEELLQGRRFGGIVQGDVHRRGASAAIVNAASLEYVFPRAEFIATLDQAVHFLGNYLCRPQWTLRQFLTPDGGGATAQDVEQRLGYLADYAYLPALIGRYLQSRALAGISSARLESLVGQIDRLVLQRGTYADLARMTRPMFEFLALGTPATSAIPLKPLLVFLADKQQEAVQDHVEQVCRMRGAAVLTFEEFTAILSGLDGISRARGAMHALPPEPIATTQEEPPPEAAAPASVPPHNGRNIPLSLTVAGLEANAPAAELPPVEKFIREEQRRFFIDAIFGNDPAFYAGVIDALNRTPSWSEAAAYLRELFESHGVDPLSDEALEFVEAVQLRYRSGRS